VLFRSTHAKRIGEGTLSAGDLCHIGRGGTSLPLGGFSIAMLPAGEVGSERHDGLGRGEQPTLRAYHCEPEPGKPGSNAVQGGREPMLTVFTDPVHAWSATAWGQSFKPASKHYSDQSQLISARRLKPTWYQWQALRDHIESVESLSYPGR
jgi:hypothetical protein